MTEQAKPFDTELCGVLENTALNADTFSVLLHAPGIAAKAKPGQFVHVYVAGKTLRRPISICDCNEKQGMLRLVFQIRGQGTEQLAGAKAGDKWDLLGPVGNGFRFENTELRTVFVGGGIGTPPLLFAARAYGKNAAAVTGFRNQSAVILQEEFSKVCPTHLTTDDGSAGQKGFVTDVLRGLSFDAVVACGPAVMLKSVAALAKEKGALCQLSLEERMACGVGACLGCAVNLRGENGQTHYGHVCKDGPVFNAEEIIWEQEAQNG